MTVVIPALNAEDLIGHQLEALAAQTFTDFEVVVADNGSTDRTAEVVHARAGALEVRVVDASGRRGVSHARNTGLREARAAKVVFCDADDIVDPAWVGAMDAALARDDVVGGHLEVERVNPPEVISWAGSPTGSGLPAAMGYLPYAVGANLGLNRQVIDTVGDFDESYVGGHEEVDLCWRAQEAGLTLGFAPDAVVHYRLRASLRAAARQRYWYGRSYAQLYRAFRDSPVVSTPVRRELRAYAVLLRSLPRDIRHGRWGLWVVTASFTLGRLAGDLRYRVRCPL